MTESAEQRAKLYGDVAAFTGLFYAFCDKLREDVEHHKDLKPKDRKRILSKVIENVERGPAAFTYTALSNYLFSDEMRK
jgi:hypothetical protein